MANTFIQTKDNKIYKKRNEHYLLVSPWSTNMDRRLSFEKAEELLANNIAVPINSQKALRLINEMFNSSDRTFIHNGVNYKVKKDVTFMDTNILVKHHKDDFLLYIGEHQGKIYWVEYYIGYFPKVCLLTFDGLDNHIGHFAKWTDAKNVRPIYKFENNNWEII